MQCRGERDNREIFLANVFFSTYQTAVGPRLAALVVDASEELRDREEFGLEQMMAGSRVLVGAVSHEIRNVCGAIAVNYENLVRGGALRDNKDFEALGSLVETLNNIASLELRQSAADSQAGGADLGEILDDLRIVLEPYCQEADIAVRWDVPESLPAVWVDRHRLLQVLLNLVKNSARALEGAAAGESGWTSRWRPRGAASRSASPIPARASPPPTSCSSRFKKAPIPPGWGCTFRAPSCARFAASCATTPRFPVVLS